MPFVKLDCGILDSTTWADRFARETFLTALLKATPIEVRKPMAQLEIRAIKETGWEVPPGWYGLAEAASPGLARLAGIGLEDCVSALERLGAPDPGSRSQDFDGRRLIRVDGGFIVLNFDKYRQKDYGSAERSRRYRNRRVAEGLGEEPAPRDAVRIVPNDGRAHSADNRVPRPSKRDIAAANKLADLMTGAGIVKTGTGEK